MRYVDRSGREEPDLYREADVANHRSMIKNYLDAGINYERPPRVPEGVLSSSVLLKELNYIFSDACAYCETDLGGQDGHLNLHRPEMGAINQDGQVDFQYYCWLATEWENLYPVCNSCSRLKGSQFPVRKRGPIAASLAYLRNAEKPLLLDPSWDIPTKHFKVDHEGLMFPITDEGKTTLEVLQLNRPELVKRRREIIYSFRDDLSYSNASATEAIDSRWFGDPSVRFRGALLIYLFSMLGEDSKFQQLRSGDVTPQRRMKMLSEILRRPHQYLNQDVELPPRLSSNPVSSFKFDRYVKSVEVVNFRGIRSAFVEFPEQRTSHTSEPGSIALLGENGTGKSTVLQAAAIGCLGYEKARAIGILADWCLRDNERSGHIMVRFFDTDDVNVVEFSNTSRRLRGRTEVDVMVLGYGPYRLPARRELGEPKRRYQYRVHSLFDERHLVNGALGLKKHFNAGDREADAVRSLNALLLNQARARVTLDGRLVIEQNGHDRPMRYLSSGYKSIVTLATDIMDVMYEVWDGATAGQALILIDEIDAHLHPAWRLRIVESLREAFPRAQFLITTHDPLVLRGLQREEVAILDNDGDQISVTKAAEVPIEGMSIDQLLTSELFGLESTENPARGRLLADYYRRLGKINLPADERIQLDTLREELGPALPIGTTKRERLVMAVVDRYLETTEKAARGDAWNVDVISDLLREVEAAEQDMANDL